MTEVIGEEGVAPGEQQAPPKADDGGTPLPHAPPSRLTALQMSNALPPVNL